MHSGLRTPFALLLLLLPALLLLGGCMTPEDRAFYGRGWLNPSELDRDPVPPPSMRQDPSAVPPHMMGPGEY